MRNPRWVICGLLVTIATVSVGLTAAESQSARFTKDSHGVIHDSLYDKDWYVMGGIGDWYAVSGQCKSLVIDGKTGWRIPEIYEARGLIIGCPETERDGDCRPKGASPDHPCAYGCPSRPGGYIDPIFELGNTNFWTKKGTGIEPQLMIMPATGGMFTYDHSELGKAVCIRGD